MGLKQLTSHGDNTHKKTAQKGLSMSFYLDKSNPLVKKDHLLGEELIIIITHFKAKKIQKENRNPSAQISGSESTA